MRGALVGLLMRQRLPTGRVSRCAHPRTSERAGPGRGVQPRRRRRAPRQAASVILLRGGADALEVLLVRRTPKARFMGGVWVFPGGAVDADEGDGDEAHRAAAMRELREEAAIALDGSRRAGQVLALDHAGGGADPLRHALLPRRAAGRPGAAGRRRGVRRPRLVHARGRARRPRAPARSSWCSRRSSTSSSSATSPPSTTLLAYARGREVQPVEPRVVLEGEVARDPAAGRARLLSRRAVARASGACCCAAITCVTALISARCVNACG